MIYMERIGEEKIKCDLGCQREISRRLCTWLEFWADLGRQHFMLSTNKEMGTQKSLFGKWWEDWWGWRGGCSGRRIWMVVWGQVLGEDECSSLTTNFFWNKISHESAETLLQLPFFKCTCCFEQTIPVNCLVKQCFYLKKQRNTNRKQDLLRHPGVAKSGSLSNGS